VSEPSSEGNEYELLFVSLCVMWSSFLTSRQQNENEATVADAVDDEEDFKSAFLDEETGEIYEGRWRR
jgi:hypothetical protein